MSDKEKRRRKVACNVCIKAWRLKRRCNASMSLVMYIAWRSFKGALRIHFGKAVGVTYNGRQHTLKKLYMMEDNEISLCFKREPCNKYDVNAIKVFAVANGKEYDVGYLPRRMASYVAPMMDAGQEMILFYDGIYRGYQSDLIYGLTFRYAVIDQVQIKKKAA
jgi:hypothetical protein